MTERASSASSRRRWLWLPAAVVGATGVALGYGIGYYASLGGLAAVGAILPGMGLGALVLIAVITGTVSALKAGGRRRGLVAPSFAAAALLVIGAAVGYASVPVLGLGYRPPVTLQAVGSLTLHLTSDVEFEPAQDSRATCGSAEDTEEVAGVSGLSLGEPPEGKVRGGFNREAGSDLVAGREVTVDLFVDGGDVPEGVRQPFWFGPAIVSELDADGRGGSITFSEIPLEGDPMGNPVAESDGWPESLTGGLRWQCGDWEPVAEPQ